MFDTLEVKPFHISDKHFHDSSRIPAQKQSLSNCANLTQRFIGDKILTLSNRDDQNRRISSLKIFYFFVDQNWRNKSVELLMTFWKILRQSCYMRVGSDLSKGIGCFLRCLPSGTHCSLLLKTTVVVLKVYSLPIIILVLAIRTVKIIQFR